MGYYYDWVEKKYYPIDHGRSLTLAQRRLLARRRSLIESLVAELASGGGTIRLYAGLLARVLVQSDEALMRELGKQVAALTDPDVAEFVRRERQAG